MEISLVRSAHTIWQRSQPYIINGMLYGMTTEGGTFGQGTVFAVPSNSIETYSDDLRTPAPCGTPTPTSTPIAAAPVGRLCNTVFARGFEPHYSLWAISRGRKCATSRAD